jgi:hypothetical protein
MTEKIDPRPYDRTRFRDDLRHTAGIIGAPFDDLKVNQSLDIFDEEFGSSVVQLKTTSRPHDGLYYRFLHDGKKDLVEVAQRHHLLPRGEDPILTLQNQVLAEFDGCFRLGEDFEAGFGLAKTWTFTGGRPIEALLGLPAMPASVAAHLDFFERHSLRRVIFVASDYQHSSMNVYSIVEDDSRTESWLRGLVEETGGAPDGMPPYADMLASLASHATVGMTFSWDSQNLHRWALYALGTPFLDARRSSPVPPLPPRLKSFVYEARTLNEMPQTNTAWSFGKAGHYMKLEKNYAKDADFFLSTLSKPGMSEEES